MQKTLYFDIETTDITLAINTYQLKNRISYFNPDSIVRDWSILGAAWAFDDEPPESTTVNPKSVFNDEKVVKKLHSALSEAEVLIGHNSDNFDIKKFNTRAIKYGLAPISQKVTIDTLKMARKYFKFTSNKLSYIADFLEVDAKEASPDWELIKQGDADELKYMQEYNEQDVIVTREVYKKLRSFHHTHPNTSQEIRDVNGEIVRSCKKCSSTNIRRDGTRLLNSGRRRQQWRCRDCKGASIYDFVK